MAKLKIRGHDRQGSGAYRASRGTRLHRGVDYVCEVGDEVRAISRGQVTKIGYPYSQGPDSHADKRALRYVQVTDGKGIAARYFYVSPSVGVGDWVDPGDVVGIAQGLGHIYAGITEHFHFEVLVMINRHKVFLDPEQYTNAQL